MAARIIGTGSYLPSLVVSNNDLEKIVDTTDEWIRSRTGIERRHIAVEETTTSMAVHAARAALENAGVEPEELDLILVGTISGDCYFPSTACQVQSAWARIRPWPLMSVRPVRDFFSDLELRMPISSRE